jgi:hypothetical protein
MLLSGAKRRKNMSNSFYEKAEKRFFDRVKKVTFEDFSVDENGFTNKGTSYNFNSIIGLYFQNSVQTQSYIVHMKNATMKIKLKNNEVITLWTMKTQFGFNPNKCKVDLLVDAYTYLRKFSFESRVNYYVNQIQSLGYFEYDGFTGIVPILQKIKIHNNGIIEKGDKKIDLNEVRNTGSIKFGLHGESITGRTQMSYPNDIQISCKKSPSLYSLSALHIIAEWDSDIIHQVIKILHDGKSIC